MNKKLGILLAVLGVAVIAFAAINLLSNNDKEGITIIDGDVEVVVAWDEITLDDAAAVDIARASYEASSDSENALFSDPGE